MEPGGIAGFLWYVVMLGENGGENSEDLNRKRKNEP